MRTEHAPKKAQAVAKSAGSRPETALADAGLRSGAQLTPWSGSGVEVILARGREGKRQAQRGADQLPHMAAMAAQLHTDEGRGKYRRRKAIVEPPQAWIQRVRGFRQFSFRGIEKPLAARSSSRALRCMCGD